jgi:hypothetical protein
MISSLIAGLSVLFLLDLFNNDISYILIENFKDKS